MALSRGGGFSLGSLMALQFFATASRNPSARNVAPSAFCSHAETGELRRSEGVTEPDSVTATTLHTSAITLSVTPRISIWRVRRGAFASGPPQLWKVRDILLGCREQRTRLAHDGDNDSGPLTRHQKCP
jgi:hypothetical protein